jgi:hypothetical protein
MKTGESRLWPPGRSSDYRPGSVLREQIGQLAQVGDPEARSAAARVRPAVHPAKGHPRSRGGPAVHPPVVAHVHRLARGDAERIEGDVEDPRVRLGVAAAFRGDDGLEQPIELHRPEARTLDAVDAVGHHGQAILAAQDREHAAAAGEEIAPGRQVVEEDLAEASRPARRTVQMDDELAEPLASQGRLGDRAAPVLLPERVVDPAIGGEDSGREGEAEVAERRAEGRSLGPVEVEQRLVDVEENGAEAGQIGRSGWCWLAGRPGRAARPVTWPGT